MHPLLREKILVVELLIFSVDTRRFALRVGDVVRVLAAVSVTELPHAPAQVIGVVNVHGQIVPVVDLRIMFGQPAQKICPHHFFILVKTPRRTLLLLVDGIHGVEEAARQDMPSLTESSKLFAGVVQLHAGVVFICDLDALLTEKDQDVLNAALSPS